MTESNSQKSVVKFVEGAMSKTQHAADSTTHYIREEPIKSVLIAAATGAVLMALVGLVSRSPGRA